MKVAVAENEWWPVYELITEGEEYFDYYSMKILIDIDPALFKRYQECMNEFNEVRDSVGELVYEARKSNAVSHHLPGVG